MAERSYIIAVDAWNTDQDVSGIKSYITSNPSISDWWNYVPYVFVVVSTLSASELSEEIKAFTKDASFIVVEANLRNSEGWLPESAWNWIRRRSREHRPDRADADIKLNS